jgi:hypothetical protein
MVDGYKVVSVTPAGRQRFVEILHKYLIDLRHIIDNHVWWINTNNQSDIDYLESLVKEYPDFYSTKYLPNHPNYTFNNLNIHNFFDESVDENTVYVRFDDDIVFIEKSEFENFIKFRIKNPQYFLVYANIVNNNFCTFIHQMIGAVGVGEHLELRELPLVDYKSFNQVIQSPNYTLRSFFDFIVSLNSGDLSNFKFNKWIFQNYERCSINCISWLGSEFAKFDKVGLDEEPWLTSYKPRERSMKNCVYGNFLVVHYSYGGIVKHIDEHNDGYFLKIFDSIAENMRKKND